MNIPKKTARHVGRAGRNQEEPSVKVVAILCDDPLTSSLLMKSSQNALLDDQSSADCR